MLDLLIFVLEQQMTTSKTVSVKEDSELLQVLNMVAIQNLGDGLPEKDMVHIRIQKDSKVL